MPSNSTRNVGLDVDWIKGLDTFFNLDYNGTIGQQHGLRPKQLNRSKTHRSLTKEDKMSQSAATQLAKCREELLKKQTHCAWCSHNARSNNELILHIWEQHSPPSDPNHVEMLREEIAKEIKNV